MPSSPDLSQEAWNEQVLAHKQRHFLPDHISVAQSQQHFATIATMALKTLTNRYANQVRNRSGLEPVYIRVPDPISDWISTQIQNVDEASGHFGSDTYRLLANSLLRELPKFEDYFRNS